MDRRRRIGMLAAIAGMTIAWAAHATADVDAAHAWLEREQRTLTSGAVVELVRIEEVGSDVTVFTIRYLPLNEVATVTCRAVFDYGWACTTVRSAFVEREGMLG